VPTTRVGIPFFKVGPSVDAPKDVQHATIDCRVNAGNRIVLKGCAPSNMPREMLPSALCEFINKLPNKWPLCTSFFPEDMSSIVDAIANGTLVMCSDSSRMPTTCPGHGAAAWIMFDSATSEDCKGHCPTSGTARDINAHRSELQGIHTGLLALCAVCTHCNVWTGTMAVTWL